MKLHFNIFKNLNKMSFLKNTNQHNCYKERYKKQCNMNFGVN